ncbi:glycoside hydrolase family 35 protein [Streptomyces sp. NPDC006487]|uniref:glycoside hydrolase family 35 protein n=1 Tax=Streptomyces sp. NPDC006487 TaxID=3364748 RepID=UPI00367F9163
MIPSALTTTPAGTVDPAPGSRTPAPRPALTWDGGGFLRHGRPHRILAGSLHYFRVHPEQWEDRLQRVAALGLNTVDTYVPWNFHERSRGDIRFDDGRDLPRFLRLAQQTGLDVIVRPGPYICAEWDNGGLPVWLTGRPGMRPRSSHREFLGEVERWFGVLIPLIAARQTSRGGPVVAVQVENEYGSYGDDRIYLRRLRDALVAHGISELLFTADGPTPLMLDGGSLPGVLAAATFGSRPDQAADLLRERRTGEPFLCAEFWNGWFDHWGEKHHVRPAPSAAEDVDGILAQGGSLSLYMAHGGTNFGLWAGANHDGTTLQPTVTSYDSDAPIAEHGALTAKFHALRGKLAPYSTGPVPVPPQDPPLLAPATLPVRRGSALLDALRSVSTPLHAANPPSFEELGQASGLVLYTARPVVPAGSHEVTVTGLHDRAQVFVDGTLVTVLDQSTASFPVTGTGAAVELCLLVENQGRINYGPLLGQGKGILGGVHIGRRLVHGWSVRSLPLDEWSAQDLAHAATASGPADGRGVATAHLHVDEPADTFLSLPGFGKGFLWVNGTLLGRYWEVGPQTTLYLPGPLLRAGDNLLTVLELDRFGEHVELLDAPRLGPCEEYIETFD